jgi:hypothetical protein
MERRDHRGVLVRVFGRVPFIIQNGVNAVGARRKTQNPGQGLRTGSRSAANVALNRIENALIRRACSKAQLRISPAESARPNAILPFGDGPEVYHHDARCTIV